MADRPAPAGSRAYIDEAGRRSWRTLISYVRATAIVALVDAVGIGIGLWILGVPLVIPLAALVFLGAFIPILGSFLAGSVAVLVALVTGGPVTALIALGIVVLVMQLEGHVMQPLLLGRAVRVHPLAVVLSIAAGLARRRHLRGADRRPDRGVRECRRHLPEPQARGTAAAGTPPRAGAPGGGHQLSQARRQAIRPSTAASAMSVRQCAPSSPIPATFS